MTKMNSARTPTVTRIRPRHAAEYLQRRGWLEVEKDGRFLILQPPGTDQRSAVTAPRNNQYRDYPLRIRQLLEDVARHEGREPHEAAREMLLGSYDRILVEHHKGAEEPEDGPTASWVSSLAQNALALLKEAALKAGGEAEADRTAGALRLASGGTALWTPELLLPAPGPERPSPDVTMELAKMLYEAACNLEIETGFNRILKRMLRGACMDGLSIKVRWSLDAPEPAGPADFHFG